MRLDTFIIITKGLAHVMVGIFTPWMGALAQWINSGEWPGRIVWIGVILPLSVLGAGNAWISFTSGSWREYQQQQKANRTGETQTTTIEPVVESEVEPVKPKE